MDNSSAGGVRAVNRALDILMAFRDGDVQLGAAELAARVKLSRPTLYRLLYTLQEAGFVQAVGEPQRFRLGASVGQLARVWSSAGSLPPPPARSISVTRALTCWRGCKRGRRVAVWCCASKTSIRRA